MLRCGKGCTSIGEDVTRVLLLRYAVRWVGVGNLQKLIRTARLTLFKCTAGCYMAYFTRKLKTSQGIPVVQRWRMAIHCRIQIAWP